MPKIVTNLWFDGQAEEAAAFYTAIFPNSRIDKVFHAPADFPSGKKGDVLTVDFTLDGQPFTGLDGGPADWNFNESISFLVECDDQAEVDRYWEALAAGGGEHGPCGWLKDRFGVSWQITPRRLQELLDSDDRDAAQRAMEAMLQMGKLDVAELEAAAAGATPSGSRA
jgi:predicted 3-demethylubiquinone-9 3-methyltransferase (glyoxalase superfamily)